MRSPNRITSDTHEPLAQEGNHSTSNWRILEMMKEGGERAGLVVMRSATNWPQITGSEKR